MAGLYQEPQSLHFLSNNILNIHMRIMLYPQYYSALDSAQSILDSSLHTSKSFS